jgi:hypothetical protein
MTQASRGRNIQRPANPPSPFAHQKYSSNPLLNKEVPAMLQPINSHVSGVLLARYFAD